MRLMKKGTGTSAYIEHSIYNAGRILKFSVGLHRWIEVEHEWYEKHPFGGTKQYNLEQDEIYMLKEKGKSYYFIVRDDKVQISRNRLVLNPKEIFFVNNFLEA